MHDALDLRNADLRQKCKIKYAAKTLYSYGNRFAQMTNIFAKM